MANIDDVVKRLATPELEPRLRIEAASVLRDSLDHYTVGPVYPNFLRRVMPVFINILRGPCIFQSNSPEQKLRNCILEILHRLPTPLAPAPPPAGAPPHPPTALEPYAVEIVDLLMTLIRQDNEENAVICVKIISEILRHLPRQLSSKIQPFLSLIQAIFDRTESMVREQLDNTSLSTSTAHGAPSTPGSTQTNFQSPRPGSPVASVNDLGPDPQQQNRMLVKGMQSFKVLAECPIIVVSIFQVSRQLVAHNVKLFVPTITSVLLLEASAQKQAHEEAKAKGEIFTGVSPLIKNRAAFGDFITAQVKTMSLLAYLLRQYQNQLADFIKVLPDVIVRLLKDCPREKSSARKELLVAIRHIINYSSPRIFLNKIDELLDERTLTGDGVTVYETMRPLAYSMLADLIHHVRDLLQPEQIRKTVEVYTKNLQDDFPGASFQTMSAKLLLNMAECIAKMPNKVDARHYLMKILNSIGDKFAAMNRQYHNAVKLSKKYAQQAADGVTESYLPDKRFPPDWDEIDIFTATPIRTANPRDRPPDPITDNKFLFRHLMNGLKNTFYQLRTCNVGPGVDPKNAPPHWQDVAFGFTAEEVKVITKLFREGAHVFRYYEVEKPPTETQATSPVEYVANANCSKEEKDLLETFATVFHYIDPATFHEVFQQEIPQLYDMIFEHTALLHIPQFFLASEATSPSFCGMLLRFLMDRIDQVGSADVRKSAILLRLFKLAFMAVTLFASHNEQVLLPHVVDIVTKSIDLSSKAEEPINYFLLLRSLFRSIGGGKFEHLYKQILPLLEMLLDVLNNLLMVARKPSERDLYVELCLTVPARLSNLLPHLSFLMRPLVVALRSGTDLVGQGLRTLELCVDNLTADYLDPIMAPVVDELMTALFDHLKPHPYSHFHAHTTMRILGKLGGRNRKFMTDVQQLNFQEFADDPASLQLRLVGSKKDRPFPAEIGIDLAIRKLTEVPKPTTKANQGRQYDSYYKTQALQFLKAQLKLRIGFDGLPEDYSRLLRLQVQDLFRRKVEFDFSPFITSSRDCSIPKKDGQDTLVKRLLKALMVAEAMPEFKEGSDGFLMNVCRHFTIIEVGRAVVDVKRFMTPFDQHAGEGPLCIDARVLGDAIVESLASDQIEVREVAQAALREIHRSTAILFGSEMSVARLPFFSYMCTTFCHSCYEEEWFTKTGGTLGIKFMLTEFDLGEYWLASKQGEFIRALLYVIKDIPQDLPEKTRRYAQETLEILLKRLAKNAKKEDLTPVRQQPGQPQVKQHRLAQICMLLNSELSNMNPHIRETAKRSLELIASAAKCQVWELVEHYRDRLLQPIYAKPLRALPFAVQIGYIDAVTYHMNLKQDWVTFDENLNRMLMECLALADASDESLANKPAEYRTQENIVALRVACIKLLSTAVAFPDFSKAALIATRTKVVAVFFKSLYSESQATIDAANDALKSIVSPSTKLPKELLQGGLRPVLANLADSKKLTEHGLNNLARILKLLTNYFKLEIGARLLDHIKAIADPNMLQQISFTFFEQAPPMKVIAAVFNVFHLLPDGADGFKERLINTVLDLEEQLRRTQRSPFRPPLFKYINRYPKEVWGFLLSKLGELKYGRFLAQALDDPNSGPLREAATADVESLIKKCVEIGQKQSDLKFSAVINTIHILDSLSRWPGAEAWMQKPEVITWLKQAGKELEQTLRNFTLPPQLRLPADQAAEQLVSILVKTLEQSPKDLDPLLSLIQSVTAGEFRATHPLYAYIYKFIICSDSIDFWKATFFKCLEVYGNKTAPQKTKWFLLHNIVNPIIAMDVMRNWNQTEPIKGPKLMDRSVLDAVSTRMWKVISDMNIDDTAQPGIDHTRFEVLQLSAMIVKYYHTSLQDSRKDIIKFGWTYIRLDDVIIKHAAYVVIGYFIALFETPAKIPTQIYLSLLRINQNEGRALVSQALELVAPVLPKRCNTLPNERSNAWALAPRRVLADEGHQTTSIFHFLVKHPDLFYEARDKYVTLIISNLRKVALPPNSTNENRKLALSMMWLIWQWEQRRVEGKPAAGTPAPESPTTRKRRPDSETPGSSGSPVMARPGVPGARALSESPNTKKRKLEGDQQMGSASPSAPSRQTPHLAVPEKAEFIIPPLARQKMIKYLIEFIAQLNDRFPLQSAKPRDTTLPGLAAPAVFNGDLAKKAIQLLYNLLQPQYWGDLELDSFPAMTHGFLASEKTQTVLTADPSDKEKYDDKFMTSIINTLMVVRVILHFKSDEWINKNLSAVLKVVEKCVKSENPEIQDCLHVPDNDGDEGREIVPIIKRILDAVPEDVPMEDADGEGESEVQTSETITSLSSIAGELMANGHYSSGVNLLWSLGQRKPPVIDQHIPILMKALQSRLAREHVQHYTAVATAQTAPPRSQDPNPPPSGEMSPYELEIQTKVMLRAIRTVALRMEVLGDNRRPFLSVLATLVEKSYHIPLCEAILDMVEGWVFRSEGTWPTLKEKTAVLHKMLSFEHRPDPTMLTKFLKLVIRIYEDPKVARSELTVRMEHAFLIGTRAQDVEMRNRFMTIMDRSLSKTATARLAYVISDQNWMSLADSYWLVQASQLLLGAVESNTVAQLNRDDYRTWSPSQLTCMYVKDSRQPSLMCDEKFEAFMAQHRKFLTDLGDVKVRDILEPLAQLQHVDLEVAHQLWVTLFPMFWSATAKDERMDLQKSLVALLIKDYHNRQIDKRPNVVQSLVEGASRAWPECRLPPHVVKFVSKTYGGWYTGLVQLEKAAVKPQLESPTVRESNLDALVDLYASLEEEDMFYGTWRRRCQFVESNAALSYEQNGMWDKAQKMYEAAQIKARTGVTPFSQAEYMLWEDHWVRCAQKLQQWDMLQDFAKHENFQDLLLECAWRCHDMWQDPTHREGLDNIIKGFMDAPTPRRLFFQAFMSLLRFHNGQETIHDFSRYCDEAIQLSIRKWHQLPANLTKAHVPLLQNFQQLVELHDASIICQSLANTTQSNLDVKSGELKLLLGAWRDRLPNVWDDIQSWQDLVTWRQHIFGLINQKYLQLLPQPGGQNAGGASFAYRGYHETAWIINRFAHVARKHNLPEVCISQLSRIYTLPNIEIQEAFLKLREQARCHYENPDELRSGLDVINNTNLNYFSAPQKAEFYTLKGMFLEKLKENQEADAAFGTALYFDITAAKAWAEWGYFNERKFKEDPTDLNSAKQALTSYLQAVGSYKSHKCRKLISRILWLLTLDNNEGVIASGFDDYKGDTPVWYWITYIPQLLSGLGYKEAPRLLNILLRIARSFPQALYFQLRTNREDMFTIKKNQEAKERAEKVRKAQQQAQQAAAASGASKSPVQAKTEKPEGSTSRPATANGETAKTENANVKTEGTKDGQKPQTPATQGQGTPQNAAATAQQQQQQQAGQSRPGQQQQPAQPGQNQPPTGSQRKPWELNDEIMTTLKTAFPLLALSMETMVDQIQKHFKCPPDEDAYRLIVALLNDALAYVSRMPASFAKDVKLPAATETNITRFAETILPAHIKKSFEADFVQVKPTMYEYIHKLRGWRNKFEEKLDRRHCRVSLESFSLHLSEFQYQKFDDVDIPGQYLLHKDKNQDFVKIDRFLPNVDLVRTSSASYRRLRMRGRDGSIHSWAVQHPAARHCRREERILQLFRHLNQTLGKKKESRRRDLQFTLPIMVPLAPHIRIVKEDASWVTLQGVYEDHCRRNKMSKDEPIMFAMEKLRAILEPKTSHRPSEQHATARLEVLNAIEEKWVPHTVVLDYFQRIYPEFEDFWLFRRQFSYQLAALTFMTYILYMHNRYPHKMHIARGSGNIWGSELMAYMGVNKPYFVNPELVPFRLTPNLQTLMGPLATEGIFSVAMLAIARCLTEPELELEHNLTLFVRDEILVWFTTYSHRKEQFMEVPSDTIRETVQLNTDQIVKRAVSLAQSPPGNLPATQTVIDLIAKAVNPLNLAQCDALWMPWL
ncbi:Histone acetylase complex subunit [Scedosporium apiospermum]|uniref:Histone acetylase complex subunit n=1 Tax=Pseudallescheria apiosperma TaxID=563466 RepID=A0A084FX37_PSEDA|nr:Histone acetylase complex subunit [Scedosporium apiospermum]KEZ39649.1 Histone acetylase complex subunit [Scedosporium apiospermum]